MWLTVGGIAAEGQYKHDSKRNKLAAGLSFESSPALDSIDGYIYQLGSFLKDEALATVIPSFSQRYFCNLLCVELSLKTVQKLHVVEPKSAACL